MRPVHQAVSEAVRFFTHVVGHCCARCLVAASIEEDEIDCVVGVLVV